MSGLRRFLRRWQNLAGLAIVGLFVFIALAAPLLAPQADPEKFSAFRLVPGLHDRFPLGPSRYALMGTVATGILGGQLDVFYTLVWGARSALRFGLLVALTTAVIGVLIGAASAYIGGWVNNLVMRITDAFLAFPVVVGVVLFEQLVAMSSQFAVAYHYDQPLSEPGPLATFLVSLDPVMVALIVFSWMSYARMTNALVMVIKQTQYIQASRALGTSPGRIILRHILPNSISPAIILAARDIGGMVLMQASFTFIGLGGGSEWGGLLVASKNWVIGPGGNPLHYWWVFVPVTLALILFGIGWNLLGDGLNDWLNPRQN